MPHQKLHKAHVSLVITNYQFKGLFNIKKNLPCQFSLIPCRTVKLMLRRGWMKRAESLLDLERIEFPFTWWYTQSDSKNKMEQQTPIPPPNQGWSRAKAKTRHFSILDLGGDGGGGGSRFSICFVQQCCFRETSFSKNTLAIGATEIESTVSLPTSIVFFFVYRSYTLIHQYRFQWKVTS